MGKGVGELTWERVSCMGGGYSCETRVWEWRGVKQ